MRGYHVGRHVTKRHEKESTNSVVLCAKKRCSAQSRKCQKGRFWQRLELWICNHCHQMRNGFATIHNYKNELSGFAKL